MSTTRQLSRAILESGDLFRDEEYSLQDLFKMRDALYLLDVYGKADLDLLREVEKWITQKVENEPS